MLQAARRILLALIIRPFAELVIGIDIIGKEKLPTTGPAIIAANHNSHVDTLIMLSLFSTKLLPKVRPVAAADHFLKTPLSTWFSTQLVGIIPVNRRGAARGEDVLAECKEALGRGEILVIFPEGSRGEPEEMGVFKSGVARLAGAFPEAPVTPVYLQGAGRNLPRDSKMLVPFNCTAVIGEPVRWDGDNKGFVNALRTAIEELRALAPPLRWK
jgi:1-acyl-sn-glycerol-3-phosphate acyltransferase